MLTRMATTPHASKTTVNTPAVMIFDELFMAILVGKIVKQSWRKSTAGRLSNFFECCLAPDL
jgi:hypothetical protein